MENENFYFEDLDKTEIKDHPIFEKIKKYSNNTEKQVYVLYRALPTRNSYGYNKACVLLIPHKKILMVNFDSTQENAFNYYYEDFIDDLGSLVDKYGYKDTIGRKRSWVELFSKINIKTLMDSDLQNLYSISDSIDLRKIELLTSLLIGSINDPGKINLQIPQTNIQKVKNKIILYDGKQSNFIYHDDPSKKIIKIQGLAGTGKTELLVQKIREKYVNEKKAKIVYLCFNNVLWTDMRKRIPLLFDFMKVDEQIKLNERLWIMKSWGNGYDSNSGLCIYICKKYGLPFASFGQNYDLEDFSLDILKKINAISDFKPCFDYLFIDESQDFNKNFLDLCEKVTAKKMYVAGDVFQNIFDTDIEKVKADLILNNCYRTAPRTLMFAHSVGMGLFEKPVLRWLTDEQWRFCGYNFIRDDGKIILTRTPIRRFEDIDESSENIVIRETCQDEVISSILESITELKTQNEDIRPEDIAIIFLDSSYNKISSLSNLLKSHIYDKFEWECNIGWETKSRDNRNSVFISNPNNIKGLEFPFVITVINNYVSDYLLQRNTIYMALTRSFLKSFLIINTESDHNKTFVTRYQNALQTIFDKNAIFIDEPTENDKLTAQKNLIQLTEKQNRGPILNYFIENYNLDETSAIFIKRMVSSSSLDNDELQKHIAEMLERDFGITRK